MSKNQHGSGQVRHVHVHLPLHLLYAFGTMDPAPHLRARSCSSVTAATSGSASHGDEWIDHAQAVEAGASAD
jgi:hypothetical protein